MSVGTGGLLRSYAAALRVAGGGHRVAAGRVHQVRADRLQATRRRGRSSSPSPRARAGRTSRGSGPATSRSAAASCAAPGRGDQREHARPAARSARRPGWSGSRRRRRRTRAPRSATGANSHGTEQEASTASATVARGASGAPNITRLPLARSTAEIRSRPSKRAPSGLDVLAQAAERAVGARRAAQHDRPGDATGGRGHATAPRSRTASRRRGRPCRRPRSARSPAPPRSRPAPRAPTRAAARSPASGRRPAASVAATIEPADVPEQVLAVAEVQAGAGLEPVQHAAQPRLAERPARAQHQSIRKLRSRHQTVVGRWNAPALAASARRGNACGSRDRDMLSHLNRTGCT